jgi:hypothetical protein
MMDHHSKRSRGFGFVTFADEAAADLVLRLDSRPVICGKTVEVKRAVPREQLHVDPIAARRQSLGPYPPYGAVPYPLPYSSAVPAPMAYGSYSPQLGLPYYGEADREALPSHTPHMDAATAATAAYTRSGQSMPDWSQFLTGMSQADQAAADEARSWQDPRSAGSAGGIPPLRPMLTQRALAAMQQVPSAEPAPRLHRDTQPLAQAHSMPHMHGSTSRSQLQQPGVAHASRPHEHSHGQYTAERGHSGTQDAFDSLASQLGGALAPQSHPYGGQSSWQ